MRTINLAQVYSEIGDTKELDTYKKLVKSDPNHSMPGSRLGGSIRTGRPDVTGMLERRRRRTGGNSK